METEDDPEYLSFLSSLRVCDDSVMFEIKPDGASSPIRVKYEELNPTCGMKPDRKRIRRDLSAIDDVMEESGVKSPVLDPDLVRSGKKRRKAKKKEGLSERKLVFRGSRGKICDSDHFSYSIPVNALEMDISGEIDGERIASERENASFEEEREDPVRGDVSVDERVEIESQDSSLQQDPVSTHFQGFMLLMKKLCPVETTIYPGWHDGNGDVNRPMAEPSNSKNTDFDWIEEKTEEVKSRHKGNKRGSTKIETSAAILDLSDFDEVPIMDIPVKVLSRPSSDYKNRLIKELKRPFDKCEYRELINKATLRNKKILYKELRPMENAIETEIAPRVRERAIETQENSNSFFDWYPEVERKVKRAKLGRRLTLMRGFFFWLQNCSWEESFKPWQKWRKGSKVRL